VTAATRYPRDCPFPRGHARLSFQSRIFFP
jgi:hypothetical protein